VSTSRGGTGGVIVNVSPAASRLGSPNEYIDHAASKGAIETFTIGLAKEVAGAIFWLASDESSYTTGSFIDVSGGR
jgi:NAD(P)-dependent dehydrogenase (short-subunit alcohol dehydrogenase family)